MIDSEKIRKQFPSLQRLHQNKPLIFLDGPAGTQVPSLVIDAISHYYKNSNANTHGEFLTTHETDAVIQHMRQSVASLLGAEGPHTISIGQNMTTLNFALARGIRRSLQKGDRVLITQLDHEANRGPWLTLRESGIDVQEVALLQDGTLDYDDMASKASDRTRVIAMGLASNALGTVNDVKRARDIAYKCGAWLVLDAVHYVPHFKVNVQELGCDFLLCSAYKFYGPHVGLLYSRPGLLDQIQTDHLRTAGQQAPEKIETGTVNHAAIAGVTAAIEFMSSLGIGSYLSEKLSSAYQYISEHEQNLAMQLYDGLSRIKGVSVVGQNFSKQHRAPTLAFVMEGKTPEQVCTFLNTKNIFAWSGHFYAIRAIEILSLLERGGVTRIGMSVYTTSHEVNEALKAIEEFARR